MLIVTALSAFCSVCNLPLGMEDGRITDNQITASNYFICVDPFGTRTNYFSPEKGRLNNGYLAWSPHTQDTNQWIQITLHQARYSIPVSGVVTQGDYNVHSWVRTYKVEYTTDGQLWQYIMNADGQHKVSNTCFYQSHSPCSNVYKFPFPLNVQTFCSIHFWGHAVLFYDLKFT